MDGLQLEIDELVFEIGTPRPLSQSAEPVPGLFGRGMEFMPIEEDVALVGVKIEGEAALEQIAGPAQILETGERVAPGDDRAVVAAQIRDHRAGGAGEAGRSPCRHRLRRSQWCRARVP